MKKLLAAATMLLMAAAAIAGTDGISTPAAQIYKKAQTSMGVCYADNGDASSTLGTVTVKFGAINKRKGTVKVSMTITPFFGKKATASKVVKPDDDGIINDTLRFKSGFGEVSFSAYNEQWEWEDEDESVECYNTLWWEAQGDSIQCYRDDIGGPIWATELSFGTEVDDLELPDGYDLVVDPPSEESIYVRNNGKKLAFDKAPSISYKRYSEDGESWYELVGLDDETKPNLSALKLSYKLKTGEISGSFKIYASNEGSVGDGAKPKLKKYTAKVKGFLYPYGGGEGLAQVKVGSNTFTWPVYIEPVDEDGDMYLRSNGSGSSSNNGKGEPVDKDEIGEIAYSTDDETGTPPDTYEGKSPILDALIDLFD